MSVRRLGSIQVLRGVAALAVVVYHARLELDWRGIAVPLPRLTVGAAGVDLFFVISGFVMVYASRPLFGSAASVPPFLLARCIRVVPLYWFFTLVRVFYIAVSNRHSALLDGLPRHLALSLGFIPAGAGGFPIIVQGWTLNYEMAFYAAFACCLPLRETRGLLVLSLGLATLAVGGGVGLIRGPTAAIANPQLFEFVAGMAIGRLQLDGRRMSGAAALAAGFSGVALLVATAPVLEMFGPWRGLVWGLPAAAIVAAATLRVPDPSRVGFPFLLRLGDASYALYLSHMLTFTLLSRVILGLAFLHPIGALAYAVIAVAVAVAAGFAAHRYIEKPLGRFFDRKTRPRLADAAMSRRDSAGEESPPRSGEAATL